MAKKNKKSIKYGGKFVLWLFIGVAACIAVLGWWGVIPGLVCGYYLGVNVK